MEQSTSNNFFSEEAIENFAGFAATLQRVRRRLIMEGYTIKEDSIEPPCDKNKEKCDIIKII